MKAAVRHESPETVTVITDAAAPASKDAARRHRQYLVAMGFRVACFISAVFVPVSWLRWTLLGFAVLIPMVAVIIANQVDQRSRTTSPVERGEPSPAPQLRPGRTIDDDRSDRPRHDSSRWGGPDEPRDDTDGRR